MLSSLFILPISAGNGIDDNGKHYTLNLLGKDWNHGTSDITSYESDPAWGGNGHRIFVKLSGKTRIMLFESEDGFGVIDADGTDGKASFELPNPYDPEDTEFENPKYRVWIRVLSPKGSANMYTVAYDEDGLGWVPSTEIVELSGKTGKKSFTDVTKELTTIYADFGEGLVRYGLFDDELQGYAWDYDNNGLRHVQMRFYPVDETP